MTKLFDRVRNQLGAKSNLDVMSLVSVEPRRTTTIATPEDVVTPIDVNLLRMIVDMVPDYTKALEAEKVKLERRIVEINREKAALDRVLVPAQEYYATGNG